MSAMLGHETVIHRCPLVPKRITRIVIRTHIAQKIQIECIVMLSCNEENLRA
jgi:hypothetical protein